MFAGLLLVAALALSVTAWWGGRLVYHHGLGVAGLPQVTGEGHDHHHGSEAASNPHDAAMSGGAGNHHGQMDESTMDAMPQGHDDASETHDHSGHAH